MVHMRGEKSTPVKAERATCFKAFDFYTACSCVGYVSLFLWANYGINRPKSPRFLQAMGGHPFALREAGSEGVREGVSPPRSVAYPTERK